MSTQSNHKFWVLNFQVARKNLNFEATLIPAPLVDFKLQLAGKKVKMFIGRKEKEMLYEYDSF